MALKEIRTDINQPVMLIEAFMGVDFFNKFAKGNVEKIVVNDREVPFEFTYTPPTDHTVEEVDGGEYWHRVRGRANAEGLYGETLELEWVYSTFKDKTYRQMRPERAKVELRCANWDSLQFKPYELFAMISATFKDI